MWIFLFLLEEGGGGFDVAIEDKKFLAVLVMMVLFTFSTVTGCWKKFCRHVAFGSTRTGSSVEKLNRRAR